MITGIIFTCMVEKGVCVPFMKEFETVEECLVGTSQTIENLDKPEGFLFYKMCDVEGEPV